MSSFVLLENCLEGRQQWDVPAVYFEIARELVGAGAAESLGMLDIADSWTAASNVTQLMNDLFASGRLVGDRQTYDDPANSLLHLVIQRGKGIPLSLAVIAAELGRRRGIPVAIIGLPGHVVVADPGQDDVYFDPFNGGGRLDAQGCRVLYERLTGLDNWQDEFLRPIESKEQVWRMLNNLKSIYRRNGDLGRLRKVMIARSSFTDFGAHEQAEFARLMRDTN